MANNTDNLDKGDADTTNPSVDPDTGEVNPSAPTVGTEGYGTTSDERRVLAPNHPSATRSGQMKGNPGDDRTTATERMGGTAPKSVGEGSGKTKN